MLARTSMARPEKFCYLLELTSASCTSAACKIATCYITSESTTQDSAESSFTTSNCRSDGSFVLQEGCRRPVHSDPCCSPGGSGSLALVWCLPCHQWLSKGNAAPHLHPSCTGMTPSASPQHNAALFPLCPCQVQCTSCLQLARDTALPALAALCLDQVVPRYDQIGHNPEREALSLPGHTSARVSDLHWFCRQLGGV